MGYICLQWHLREKYRFSWMQLLIIQAHYNWMVRTQVLMLICYAGFSNMEIPESVFAWKCWIRGPGSRAHYLQLYPHWSTRDRRPSSVGCFFLLLSLHVKPFVWTSHWHSSALRMLKWNKCSYCSSSPASWVPTEALWTGRHCHFSDVSSNVV